MRWSAFCGPARLSGICLQSRFPLSRSLWSLPQAPPGTQTDLAAATTTTTTRCSRDLIARSVVLLMVIFIMKGMLMILLNRTITLHNNENNEMNLFGSQFNISTSHKSLSQWALIFLFKPIVSGVNIKDKLG